MAAQAGGRTNGISMSKLRLYEWLPRDSDETVEHSKRYRRYLDGKIRRLQATFSPSEVMPEAEALDLWCRLIERIDARLGGLVAKSDQEFLWDYIRPYAVEVTSPLPSPEGYVVLVEDYPGIGLRVPADGLPSLDRIRFLNDNHIVPLSRPTWLLSISHEGFPPLQLDLRQGKNSLRPNQEPTEECKGW
jgi:hypothetical protein